MSQMPTSRESRRPRYGWLSAGGAVLTLVAIEMMRGSRWPTAFFPIAGLIVTPLLALLFATVLPRVIRWPGTLALLVSVSLLAGLGWWGKFPDPAATFRKIMKTDPPPDITSLTARCGWFDGCVTVIHFKADPATIRRMLPQKAVSDLVPLQPSRETASRWPLATGVGPIVDPSLAQYPHWKAPFCTAWSEDRPYGEQANVSILWDDETGQALIVQHEP